MISKSELSSFLEDMYRGDKLMIKVKFARQVRGALPLEFVKITNNQFPVLKDDDWPVINSQLVNSKATVIDRSYISKAKFIDGNKVGIETIYTEISFPLFNKAKNICIIQVSTRALCGIDEIRIYKKGNNNKWELYQSIP